MIEEQTKKIEGMTADEAREYARKIYLAKLDKETRDLLVAECDKAIKRHNKVLDAMAQNGDIDDILS